MLCNENEAIHTSACRSWYMVAKIPMKNTVASAAEASPSEK